MREKFDKLKTQVDTVVDLLRNIDRARSLPREYHGRVERLIISSAYQDNEAKIWADVAKSETLKMAKDKGDRDRDQRLHAIAMNLHAIRAILPELAAHASIELGEIAHSITP
jgi:hypothetical protein